MSAAFEVFLDLDLDRLTNQAMTIDLCVLKDTLDIIPGFRERDELNPVNRIDLARTRITIIPICKFY